MSDVTQLLQAAVAGDPRAAGELLPLVYDELRRLAALKVIKLGMWIPSKSSRRSRRSGRRWL